MSWRLLKVVVVLPGTVLVLVPAIILWAVADTGAAAEFRGPVDPGFWIGAAVGLVGIAFAVWTVRLFVGPGEGTPAPWDPPQKLVVRGPYRHVRNPMIASVYMMLFAESLILNAWPLAVWLIVFFAVNALYIPRSEEPGLAARFGEDYRQYKANVPRWIPNPLPWNPDDEGESS
ncbi:MAG: isoprenylcysteine carboxylmethyltransferase family protein [Rhodospirillaceae bacterium]|jgi:protein-S-isoprenylcysteine O-methyltransferase Ste14|nr:isoprenylcysteine carboxylmethyltransferase family protein [Rhodospirillaceae bacterium]MBT4772215.1 isoprenylcysteine carboxylmethyltransferase family protein [Rhodospirillaceae bacterium]MBT5359502.1 isoprenylcysteine carboxylmethyltransferase family protein [Rhodospirillaceae bacterium]MBT5768305.1 isoprenylcysteine carboxylmethyltransferase family protein [Rhodospirillaceae bacterium]MBT6309664.1 isoprenylcysteine carboxylmethyltransferase family protein [Rhodospirillaceae bacterium]